MSRRALFGLVLIAWVTASLTAGAGTVSGGAAVEKAGACFCGFDADGAPICYLDRDCDDSAACTANGDCPAGEACIIDSCCPFPKDKVCAPLNAISECVNPGVCAGGAGWTTDGCEPPLLVELESFTAELVGGQIALYWTTSSEIDNVGFRLMRARGEATRADSGKGAERREVAVSLELVTDRLIPAQGTEVQGASYRFVDRTAQKPGVVFYYLEDMDTSGKATLHGPIRMVVPAPVTRRR